MEILREQHKIEVGSKVIFADGRGRNFYVLEVNRMTATMIMAKIGEHEYRFHRKNGKQVTSDEWYRAQIYPATPENMAEFEQIVAEKNDKLEKSELTDQIIVAVKSRKLPLEALRKLAAIVEEYSD